MKKLLIPLSMLASAQCFAADSAYSVLKDDSKVGQYELAWEYDLDFPLEAGELAKVKEVPAGQTKALAINVIELVTTSKLVSGLQPDQYPAALFCRDSRVIVMTSAAHTKYYTDSDCSLLQRL
jgi:hypothetical protein